MPAMDDAPNTPRRDVILIADASPEGQTIASSLRAQGFAVAFSPIERLEARVLDEAPRVLLVDIDEPGARDAIERLRELPGGRHLELVCFGNPSRAAEVGASSTAGRAFARPLDIHAIIAQTAALVDPAPLDDDSIVEDRRPEMSLRPGETIPPGFFEDGTGAFPSVFQSAFPGAPEVAELGSSVFPPDDGEGHSPPTLLPTHPMQLSPDLMGLLASAEQRVLAEMPHASAHPPAVSPEEDVDLVLADEFLAILEEPIDAEEDFPGSSSVLGQSGALDPGTGPNALLGITTGALAALSISDANPSASSVLVGQTGLGAMGAMGTSSAKAARPSEPRSSEPRHSSADGPATAWEPQRSTRSPQQEDTKTPAHAADPAPQGPATAPARRTSPSLAEPVRGVPAMARRVDIPIAEPTLDVAPPTVFPARLAARWASSGAGAPNPRSMTPLSMGVVAVPPELRGQTPSPVAVSVGVELRGQPTVSMGATLGSAELRPQAPGSMSVSLGPSPSSMATTLGQTDLRPQSPRAGSPPTAPSYFARNQGDPPPSVRLAPPVPPPPAPVSSSSSPADAPAATPRAQVMVLGPGEAPRALARAIASRATGALVLNEGSVARRVLLHDGDVVTSSSTQPEETLLAYLTGRGDIERDVAARLAGKLPASGRHAGAALIAHGYLAQDALWTVLRAHAEWLIGRAIVIDAGTLELEIEPPARLRAEPSVFGGATGAEVFVEVTRRITPPELAMARLGGPHARIDMGSRSMLISECALRMDEAEVVGKAPGKTVAEIVDGAGPEASSLLWALVCLEVLSALVPSRPAGKERARVEDPLDEEAIRYRVRARLSLVEDGDYFALLGIARSATSYEVRRAYLELRRAFEPSRLLTAATADLGADVRLVLEVLDEAYEILKDTNRRERYRRAIEAGPPA